MNIRIKDSGAVFKRWSVCKGCPECLERVDGFNVRRMCRKELDTGLSESRWVLASVPRDCSRYMEQMVLNQKKP